VHSGVFLQEIDGSQLFHLCERSTVVLT